MKRIVTVFGQGASNATIAANRNSKLVLFKTVHQCNKQCLDRKYKGSNYCEAMV